jgi:predicted transposase/invertase (TIGR01784 family)
MLITEWDNEKAMQVQRREGIEEGEAKQQRETVLAMLEANEPIEKIARYTKLSPAEIEALQSTHYPR